MIHRVLVAGRAARAAAAVAAFAAVPAGAAPEPEAPLLTGPVVRGGAPIEIASAALRVRFGESARTAQVEYAVRLAGAEAGEAEIGFEGVGVRSLRASLDGVPVPVEQVVASGRTRFALRVPVRPGEPTLLVVTAWCDTVEEERAAPRTYPQAWFVRNRVLDAARARVLLIDPGPHVPPGRLVVRVEAASPRTVEAPLDAAPTPIAGGEAVEGTPASDVAVPFRVAAVEGTAEAPSDWGVAFGMGIAIDWPRVENVTRDDDGNVTARSYSGPPADDPATRIWFRGLFLWALGPWMLSTGLEGDWNGTLEAPFMATWFPAGGTPSDDAVPADYRLSAGVAVQILNDRSPGKHGLDPRIFLRAGAGMRLLLLTCELAYEIAPPMGAWDGPRGGLEHKLLLTFPWAF